MLKFLLLVLLVLLLLAMLLGQWRGGGWWRGGGHRVPRPGDPGQAKDLVDDVLDKASTRLDDKPDTVIPAEQSQNDSA